MDWVLVNWYGTLQPCQIWMFLDLRGIAIPGHVEVDDVAVGTGVYAVVECADYIPMPEDRKSNEYKLRCDLVTPCVKSVAELDEFGLIAKRKFYLADVEAFHGPIACYPDFGADNKAQYLAITPYEEWSTKFLEWLREPVNEVLMKDEVTAYEAYLETGEFEDYYWTDAEYDSDEEESDEGF